VVLKGDNSVGEFYSVALTNNKQQADTGTKMVHVGKNTRSRIVSKGISAGQSVNAYRGLVQVRPAALLWSLLMHGMSACVCFALRVKAGCTPRLGAGVARSAAVCVDGFVYACKSACLHAHLLCCWDVGAHVPALVSIGACFAQGRGR
jgi:hypothetical protein